MNARVGPLFRYVTQRSFVRCHSDTAAYNGVSRRRRRCPEARCGVNAAAAAAYRSFCASVSVSLGRQPAVIAASSSQSGPPITRSPDTYPATLRVQLDGATLAARALSGLSLRVYVRCGEFESHLLKAAVGIVRDKTEYNWVSTRCPRRRGKMRREKKRDGWWFVTTYVGTSWRFVYWGKQ